MSSPLAIAAVTRVLKDLLNDGMIDHDVSGTINNNVIVTALPPDHIDTGSATENTQLNLFMYMASFNQGWKNHNYPSHNSRGDRISNPLLALDLHYLLTAYGSEELHTEILLGYGMQLLHENPVLARDAISTALAPNTSVEIGVTLPPHLRSLSNSGLADQIEQIKITPETLNTEELSRLWTAFGSKYRPHAAYKASVVLIESTKSTKSSLPVRARKIYVRPFKQPFIEKVCSQSSSTALVDENQKILAGYNLVLKGMNLKSEVVSVKVGDMEVESSDFISLNDQQIVFPISNGLSSGIQGVQIVHSIPMGIDSPPSLHKGVSSNVEAFVLSPRILPGTIIFSPEGIDSNGRHFGSIDFQVSPEVTEKQRIVILLNEFDPDPEEVPRAYSFETLGIALLSPPGPTSSINISVKGIEAATYLMRVQVDGAESPIDSNAALVYNSPTIAIP